MKLNNLFLMTFQGLPRVTLMMVFVFSLGFVHSNVNAQDSNEEMNWTTFSNKQRAQSSEGEVRENTDYVLVTYDKESIQFIYPDRNDLIIKFPISSKYNGIDDVVLYTDEEGISNIRIDDERNVTVYYEDQTIISFETDLYFYWTDQSKKDSTTVVDLSGRKGR
ncbi:hypothetical protein QQ020_17415 [Fulvivirgaceae bacterium BMA12]|uniref:Uncharacterized protein n=1 Tax=Agaribacillus aureus TaxID=3051825 RepID=A0ABT8LA22_9BACT|nr:hypothetical protein [Fulvivirgaceae bacterium BMA12]